MCKSFVFVWIRFASLMQLRFTSAAYMGHNKSSVKQTAAFSFSAAEDPACAWETPGQQPADLTLEHFFDCPPRSLCSSSQQLFHHQLPSLYFLILVCVDMCL